MLRVFFFFKYIFFFTERGAFKNRDECDLTTISTMRTSIDQDQSTMSTVPEVYVRPPTPTVSTMNLPIITVSCPSRRSSLVNSRRGSDASKGSSRRNSECSVRFINDDGTSPTGENKQSPIGDRFKTPEGTPEGILRRHSEMVTPTGSTKDLRRCSDFTHEKNRSSQFAMKLRRNSDFGNRTPKRMLPQDEQPRLPQVLDVSPGGEFFFSIQKFFFKIIITII